MVLFVRGCDRLHLRSLTGGKGALKQRSAAFAIRDPICLPDLSLDTLSEKWEAMSRGSSSPLEVVMDTTQIGAFSLEFTATTDARSAARIHLNIVWGYHQKVGRVDGAPRDRRSMSAWQLYDFRRGGLPDRKLPQADIPVLAGERPDMV